MHVRQMTQALWDGLSLRTAAPALNTVVRIKMNIKDASTQSGSGLGGLFLLPHRGTRGRVPATRPGHLPLGQQPGLVEMDSSRALEACLD